MKGIGVKRVTLPEAPFEWLLRDEFTDTRAAGAVNGTAATPGPGTRVVTDTDGDALSVGGGVVSFANPNGVWGDPGLWYRAFARTAGRVLLFNATIGVASKLQEFGWDSGQAGSLLDSIYFYSDNAVAIRHNLVVYPAIGPAYATGTAYSAAVIQRTVGAYHMFKVGANWTLLWVGSVSVADPLYPAAVTNNGTFSMEWFRIPAYLYLPPVQAYDTFTRANGALGSSEGTGPEGQGVSARSWANQVGTTLVAGNAASASVLAGGIAIATVETATADVLHGAKLTRAGNEVGVVVRYADSNNYVRAYHDGANAKLDKVVGGVVTNVITAAQAYAAGAYIWVICDGTQFDLYYNNTKIGATGTIADAALQNGTEHGLYSTNVGNSQDDMLTMPRGTEGQYNGLDKYGG